MSGYCDDCGNTLCVCGVTNNFIATNAEPIARRFHETYERLAPSFGYETRPESTVPWEYMPEHALLVAVVTELLSDDVLIPGAGLQDCDGER
jgi:hypothetical protein